MKLLLAFLVATSGCGSLDSYRRSLAASERALTSSLGAMVEADAEFQSRVVEKARTLDEGKKALEDYRAKRNVAVRALNLVSELDAVGHVLIAAVENKQRPIADLDGWIAELLPAVLAAKRAISVFLGGQ